MGVFSTNYEKEAEELWEKVKKDLRPKDGLKHILYIYGPYTATEYNTKINFVVEKMQKDGYSIIDVKFVYEDANRTLIMYE